MEWLQSAFSLPEAQNVLSLIIMILRRIVAFIGVVVIVWGAFEGIYYFICQCQRKSRKGKSIDLIRLRFGRTIILGLEFIVASDVIETTTAPDYYSVGILAALVGIRTLLTFFMNRELMTISKSQNGYAD